jgi:hypothetical protein
VVSVAVHLKRKRALDGRGPFDPFALPSLKELAEPIEAPPSEVLATVYDCRCFDCGAQYAIALDSLAEFGAPDCNCGAGALRSDALEAYADETREADGPQVLRERWVETRALHYCETCHCDLPAGERALNRVTSEEGELRSAYIGMCCFGQKAQGSNPNGTQFYDQTMGGGYFVTAEGVR